MLGNPGSNPLELFWDVVDELDQVLDECIQVAEKAFKDRDFTVTADTQEEDLLKVLQEAEKDDQEIKKLSNGERCEIWRAVSNMYNLGYVP